MSNHGRRLRVCNAQGHRPLPNHCRSRRGPGGPQRCPYNCTSRSRTKAGAA